MATIGMVIVASVVWVFAWRVYREQITFEGQYEVAHHLNFGDIAMEGYTLEGVSSHRSGYPNATPGDELELTVYWRHQVDRPSGTPKFYLRMATNRDEWALVPLQAHPIDDSAMRRSSASFRVPQGLPPGTYQLEIGVLGESEPWMVGYSHQHLFHGLSEAVLRTLVVTEPTFDGTSDLTQLASVGLTQDLTLAAYDVARGPEHRRQLPGPATSVTAGDGLRLTLLWRAESDELPDITFVARLLNAEGDQYAATHESPAGGLYSSRYWEARQLVRDVMDLSIPPDTPPGAYRVTLEARGSDGIIGDQTTLRELDLGAARPSLLAPPSEPTIPLASGIELVGAERAPAIGPGERLHVMVHWWGRTPGGNDMLARLALEDGHGRVLADIEGPPAGVAYPTSRWRENERIGHWFRLLVPAETPSGENKLMLSLVTPGGLELAKADLGGIEVVGHARRFDLPDNLVPINVSFGGTTLHGYRLDDAAGSLTRDSLEVLLAWRAVEPSTRNLSVSVQVIDSTGRLVAQHDGVPQDGRAPTPSWVRDEVVEDRHVLRVPAGLSPGEYSLRVVLYDSETGQRLVAGDGRDYAFLQILTIAP